MVDYEQIIQGIIQSLKNFSFEFDFGEVKSKMELREISKSELEQLGEEKIKENFITGAFIIKLSDEKFIDYNSLHEHCTENKIKEPILFVNPDFKYVRWEITTDLTTPQIKKHIKRQLVNNNDISLDEAQKELIKEDIKNKEIVGYLNELPVKTSNSIKEGKFYIQITCSNESALKLTNESIDELKTEKVNFVRTKIKRDRKNACIYFIFVVIITILWFIDKYCEFIPSWLSNSIGIILYIVPLAVLQILNYSFIQSVFNRVKAERKYEKEFNEQVN